MDSDRSNERAYLLRRAADHRRQASRADPAHQGLHERFATLYEERATALEVQQY